MSFLVGKMVESGSKGMVLAVLLKVKKSLTCVNRFWAVDLGLDMLKLVMMDGRTKVSVIARRASTGGASSPPPCCLCHLASCIILGIGMQLVVVFSSSPHFLVELISFLKVFDDDALMKSFLPLPLRP